MYKSSRNILVLNREDGDIQGCSLLFSVFIMVCL